MFAIQSAVILLTDKIEPFLRYCRSKDVNDDCVQRQARRIYGIINLIAFFVSMLIQSCVIIYCFNQMFNHNQTLEYFTQCARMNPDALTCF